MKKLLIAISLIVAFWAGQAFEAHRCSAENTLPEGYDFSGVEMMENYIMDVIDETDFWEMCDSTSFRDYAENSPEWMFNVILEYKNWECHE